MEREKGFLRVLFNTGFRQSVDLEFYSEAQAREWAAEALNTGLALGAYWVTRHETEELIK